MSSYPDSYLVKKYEVQTRINNLRLMLEHGPTIVIEGPDDNKVLHQLFYSDDYITPQFLHIKGKKNVKEALSTIQSQKTAKKCKGIVDPDYEIALANLEKRYFTCPKNLIYLDANSLETLLWKMDNGKMLVHILDEIFDPDVPSSDINKSLIEEIKRIAFDAAYKIGLVRLIANKQKWEINFKNINIVDKMFDRPTQEFNINTYIDCLLDENPDYKSKKDQLNVIYSNLPPNLIDKWDVMRGHDLSDAFSYAINYKCRGKIKLKVISSNGKYTSLPEISTEYFEAKTRDACPYSNLEETNMYKVIRKWLTNLSTKA